MSRLHAFLGGHFGPKFDGWGHTNIFEDRAALIAGGHQKGEGVVVGQKQLVSDTLALSLRLVKTKLEVKKEKMEGWVERRRREAAEKSSI